MHDEQPGGRWSEVAIVAYPPWGRRDNGADVTTSCQMCRDAATHRMAYDRNPGRLKPLACTVKDGFCVVHASNRGLFDPRSRC